MNRSALKGLAVALAVVAAFALGRYGRGPAEPPPAPPPPPSSPASPPPAATAPGTPSEAAPAPPRACVGPGSTRDEVRAALGEPDSISGGWWYYGRAQFHLGSGTVQDFINAGSAPLC